MLASERDHSKPQKLKSLSTKRWSAKTDNCRALLETLPSVIETLERIQTGDRFDKESSGTAMALTKAIDFEFCLHLVALSKILSVTGVLSRYFQKEDMDIKYSCSKDKMKVSYYFATLDLAIQSITDRFNSETLPLLKHTICFTKPSTENVPHLKSLCEFFIGDVNMETAEVEYRMFIHRLQREEQRPSSLMDIFIYMVERKYQMAYPELSKLCQLITLPVTSCSNERCFSSLKLIKNRLRTTMSQDRMSDLMVTAAEADRCTDAFWRLGERH
uniref:HAT C-terminal dimerisation domain-containing protein n=1 Tax=Sinocyclocheilus grahami TaxID=75366 RepID=A0A672NNS3_SINGR